MAHEQPGAHSSGCRHRLRPTRVLVVDVPVDVVDLSSVLGCFDDFLACGQAHVVHQVSVDPINVASKRDSVRDALQQSDLNIPDSVGVTWGLSRLYDEQIPRLPGVDLLRGTLAWGSDRQIKHAFVGATPATLASLRGAVTEHTPEAIVTDMIAVPFRAITASGVAEDVRRLRERPDILWVGLGTPRQQEWAAEACLIGAAPIIVTIGAAFDFMAGTRSRGPAVMRDHGFEWLYRLVSEPRRLWRRYLVGNPAFVLAVERQRRSQSS